MAKKFQTTTRHLNKPSVIIKAISFLYTFLADGQATRLGKTKSAMLISVPLLQLHVLAFTGGPFKLGNYNLVLYLYIKRSVISIVFYKKWRHLFSRSL